MRTEPTNIRLRVQRYFNPNRYKLFTTRNRPWCSAIFENKQGIKLRINMQMQGVLVLFTALSFSPKQF